MNSAERNYEIYDKELLAVVESFKHWRTLSTGWTACCNRAVRPQKPRVLHVNKKLTRRQPVGLSIFPSTTLPLHIGLAKLNGRADPCPDDTTYKGEDDHFKLQRIGSD
ncbi:hypothetical protein BASA83_007475 [Batrachochytrium salamandrivorans]|nr:hypothetical protein BASA83_007475 [Batrachochytrium salamandrivorans]